MHDMYLKWKLLTFIILFALSQLHIKKGIMFSLGYQQFSTGSFLARIDWEGLIGLNDIYILNSFGWFTRQTKHHIKILWMNFL